MALKRTFLRPIQREQALSDPDITVSEECAAGYCAVICVECGKRWELQKKIK
jgi:hypothetical protein